MSFSDEAKVMSEFLSTGILKDSCELASDTDKNIQIFAEIITNDVIESAAVEAELVETEMVDLSTRIVNEAMLEASSFKIAENIISSCFE